MSEIILYDHRKKREYSLDFSKWLAAFNDGSSFYENWQKKLNDTYSLLECTPNMTDDCFQYTYISNGETLYINFNIGYIYSQCEKHQLLYLHKKKVSLNEFALYPGKCKYAFHYAINSKFLLHAASDFPILCCTAPSYGRNCMLVIDGNHRITIKKFFHIGSVNVFEYQINSAFDFANVFEYSVFQFLLEYNKRRSTSFPISQSKEPYIVQ